MARAPAASIAQRRGVAQSSLNRQLRRWLFKELGLLRPQIVRNAARCHAERYRKHFCSFSHACLLIFHGLSGGKSLRQSFEAFATCRDLATLAGLASSTAPQEECLSVSFSQFADSNTTRPFDFLAGIVPALVAQVRRSGQSATTSLPLDLHLLDSTFLRLSLALAPWLPKTRSHDRKGVRLQVQYLPALDLPEHVLLTDTFTNDCGGLDQAILNDPKRLAALRDQTLVVDLGYYSHRRFAMLLRSGVHLVSRLHPQAKVCLLQELPVQSALPTMTGERITVISDQRVKLGSENNRAGAALSGLRLVTADVAPSAKAAHRGAKTITYRIITDRFDLAASEVILSYLWRWQIELFFRWLKSHLQLPRTLGYSPNAVALTAALALIVHLLVVLAAHALGRTRRSPALLRRIAWALGHLSSADHPPDLDFEQLSLPLECADLDSPTPFYPDNIDRRSPPVPRQIIPVQLTGNSMTR
jgi:hypothetical protein